jgi:hypothetical protein
MEYPDIHTKVEDVGPEEGTVDPQEKTGDRVEVVEGGLLRKWHGNWDWVCRHRTDGEIGSLRPDSKV